jgi:hypothetical protein
VAEGTAPLLLRGDAGYFGKCRPRAGINVRVNGNEGVSGGTSAVAPQWAALAAVISQFLAKKADFFIPLLYANAKAATTNDIDVGNNLVCGVTGFFAKAGRDACTGLGSPNGTKPLRFRPALAFCCRRSPIKCQWGAAPHWISRRNKPKAQHRPNIRSEGGRALRSVCSGRLYHRPPSRSPVIASAPSLPLSTL